MRKFDLAQSPHFLAASGLGICVSQSAYNLIECCFDVAQFGLLVASLQDADCIGDAALTEIGVTEAKARNANAVGMIGMHGSIESHLADGLGFGEFAEFRKCP